MRTSTFFFLFFALHLTAQAQVDTSILYDEVIIQGLRTKVKKSETSRDVRVITAKDLKSAGMRSVDEAVQILGGVEVQTRGVYGTQADFSMRGSTYSQVLVLVDGQSISDPLTGHFGGNIPLSMEEVQRIEVIRGPSTAIYGPNAVGGVINIVTYYSEREMLEDRVTLGMGLGEYGLQMYRASTSFAAARWGLFASWERSKADGPPHPGDSTTQFFRNEVFSVGLVAQPLKKLSLRSRLSFYQSDFDARYFYTRSTFDRSVEGIDRRWLQADAEYAMSDGNSLHLSYSMMDTEDDFLFHPDFPRNLHQTRLSDVRLDWRRVWSKKWSSQWGAQGQMRSIESTDRGNHEEVQWGLFATGRWKVSPGWNMDLALRLDHHEIFDFQWSPQWSLNYAKGGWRLHTLIGRTVRAADFTERYISNVRTTTLSSGRNLGNAGLDAEKAWNFELGSSYQFAHGLFVGATAFYRKSRDLIDYVWTPTSSIEDTTLLEPGGSYFYTQNIAELNTAGIEFLGQFDWHIVGKWHLKTEMGATWMHSQGNEDIVSKYISNHARLFMNWAWNLSNEQWIVGMNGVYKQRDAEEEQSIGAIIDESYHVFNARVEYVFREKLHLYTQLHNVLNRKYSDILGARLPGRWWSAGIILKITY